MSRQLKIILLAGMALIMGFYSDCPAYAALSVNVNCVEDTYADWSSTNSNYGGASIVRIPLLDGVVFLSQICQV